VTAFAEGSRTRLCRHSRTLSARVTRSVDKLSPRDFAVLALHLQDAQDSSVPTAVGGGLSLVASLEAPRTPEKLGEAATNSRDARASLA